MLRGWIREGRIVSDDKNGTLPTTQQLKTAKAEERKLLATLKLLGVKIVPPGCFSYEGQAYLVKATSCTATAAHFGSSRRANRLLRVFGFIRIVAVMPGNAHWEGVIAKPMEALAALFPALQGDLWAIKNGCAFGVNATIYQT